jgi:hypothetical protein
LVVVLGTLSSHQAVRRLMERERPLTDPEAFLLEMIGGSRLLAAAADSDGVLYAAGAILPRADVGQDGIDFPAPLEIRTAPAFEIVVPVEYKPVSAGQNSEHMTR